MLTADCRDSDANDSRWGDVALMLRLLLVLIATWAPLPPHYNTKAPT